MNSSDLMWFDSIWFNLNYNLWSTSQHPSKSQEHRKHCTLLITTIVYFTPYITYSARPLTPSPLPFGSPLALSPLSILPWPCLSTYSLRLSSPSYPFSVGCRPHVPRLLCYPTRPGRCCTPTVILVEARPVQVDIPRAQVVAPPHSCRCTRGSPATPPALVEATIQVDAPSPSVVQIEAPPGLGQCIPPAVAIPQPSVVAASPARCH